MPLKVDWPRRSLLLFAAGTVGGCASSSGVRDATPSNRIVLAEDLAEGQFANSKLIDVRGETERRRDGIPGIEHTWVPFGPDRWRGMPDAASQADFLRRITEHLAIDNRPLVLICSIGVRSAAAVRLLADHGVGAESIEDGWLGNDFGPGLRRLLATA
jgi:rhodanese-related sulfurtransferase